MSRRLRLPYPVPCHLRAETLGSASPATLCLCAIALSVTASALTLTWNPNPETDIAGYHLRYGTSPGIYTNAIAAGTNTTASVTDLQEGTTYYFAVTAVNQAGLQSAPSNEISHTVPTSPTLPTIPRAGWTLKSASSQETQGEDGKAVNAFDGNPQTFWHSQWQSASPPPPHEIQIDLGTAYSIGGFNYLPRQDGDKNGNIGQYEFYVSMDGLTWGAPVASGTFTNSQTEKQVLFAARSGRYVRLIALSDANGGIFCSVAELNLIQGETLVPPVNSAPVAVNDSATTAEDAPVAIMLSASDKDGNPLTYSIVSGPAKGTLSGTAPNLTYTPAADFSGMDSFTYKANDGTADSNTATASIAVTAVNDAPVALTKSATTAEDSPVAIALTASDKDGNPLTYSIVSGPAKGTLSGTAPNLTYTPAADFSGTDSFTFKANDGTVDSNTATVAITVTAANDVPVAVAKSATTAEDTAGRHRAEPPATRTPTR